MTVSPRSGAALPRMEEGGGGAYRVLDSDFEPGLTATGRYMLEFRYLAPDGPEGRETPGALFRRVAWSLAEVERTFRPDVSDREVLEWAERFFRVMIDGSFLPNAPTLLAAGRPLGQLFACFVLPVPDSIHGIFDAVRMAALVQSKGGGTGFSFSGLRGRGRPIATGGVSTGAVSFLRVFDEATEVIRSGGTGWGANMGVLRCDHPDVVEFVEAKSDGRSLRNFNLSVGATDAFMEACREGGELPLVDPVDGVETGRMEARRLLDLLARQAWATGDPGLLFLDRIEEDNPTPALGPLEATNPCGEAPLLPFEACCLGGVNVAWFRDPAGDVRWDELRRVSGLALRMMDNVIEASRFPLPEIREAVRRTRKVGIGLMGLADLLAELDIPYGSPAAAELAGRLMQEVRDATRSASVELGRERGSFPAFAGSPLASRHPALRNATTTSNPPNSTISTVAGCSGGIEPVFALAAEKHLANGDRLRELHPGLMTLAAQMGYDTEALTESLLGEGDVPSGDELPEELRRRFPTAHEVAPRWHLEVQAAVQQHTDLGVSKTINLPRDATPEDVRDVLVRAWELGCKGITCFRDGCLDRQFMTSGAATTASAEGGGRGESACPSCAP